MSFASRHNAQYRFNVNTTGFEFKSLKELYSEQLLSENEVGKVVVYPCLGLFISKGQFGEHGVIITDKCFVSLPQHLTDDIKEILSSEDDIFDIVQGRVGFTIYEYSNKYNDTPSYSIQWKDL